MPVVLVLLSAVAQHIVLGQSLRRHLQESIGSSVPTDTFRLLLRDRRLPFGVGRHDGVVSVARIPFRIWYLWTLEET